MVAIPIVDSILNLFKTTIDKAIPDANVKEQVKLALTQLNKAELDAALSVITSQLEINKVEAASGSLFRGGWRPFLGWVCGVSLAYVSLISPILAIWVKMPVIDTSVTMQILTGMLGLGTMRAVEKIKGVG